MIPIYHVSDKTSYEKEQPVRARQLAPQLPRAQPAAKAAACPRSLLMQLNAEGGCIARSGKLDRARSRLYRTQILQVNARWKALAEIYTMHSFAPFFNLKI